MFARFTDFISTYYSFNTFAFCLHEMTYQCLQIRPVVIQLGLKRLKQLFFTPNFITKQKNYHHSRYCVTSNIFSFHICGFFSHDQSSRSGKNILQNKTPRNIPFTYSTVFVLGFIRKIHIWISFHVDLNNRTESCTILHKTRPLRYVYFIDETRF